MSRCFYTFSTPLARSNCLRLLAAAPDGTRVEIKGPRRTIPQNDCMWALLTEVAEQLELGGRLYSPEDWKSVFLHAFGRETRFLPSLDGTSFVPIAQSSSDLTAEEMDAFIEFILAEGAQRGVVFGEPKGRRGRAA